MNLPTTGHSTFIPGVEGLRALAVLSVLFFHLEFAGVAGGYLGVDLFFVISGFIITRNILGDSLKGRFTLRDFYVRRFRRLFPALVATILVTLVVASIVMPPHELENAAASGIYAVFSLANINFWLESGYFDAAAHYKPLLHTWSLSVEEQFYLFWPVMLLLVSVRRSRALLAAILLLLSLLVSVFYMRVAPEAVFYLLPFRVHQLMAGALIAILGWRLLGGWGNASILLGTLAFLALVLLTGPDFSPAIGAVGVTLIGFSLLLGCESRLAVSVYGWAPLQWIGSRSYALYLVHWPLIVLFKFATDFGLNNKERLFLFVASFVLAVALHELVEKPFRKRGPDSTLMQRKAVPFSMAAMLLLLSLAGFIIQQEGLKGRGDWVINRIVESARMAAKIRRDEIRYGVCNLHEEHKFSDYSHDQCAKAEEDRVNVIVIGDSMAADVYMMLKATYPDFHLLQATAGACTPLLSLRESTFRYHACLALNDLRFSTALEQDIDLVVMAAMWRTQDMPAIVETVEHVRKKGLQVLLFGPRSAYRGRVPTLLAKEASLDGINEKLAQHVVQHKETLELMRQSLPGVQVVDMHEIQCKPDCIAMIDSELLYMDAVHFTPTGARVMGERSRAVVDLESLVDTAKRAVNQ